MRNDECRLTRSRNSLGNSQISFGLRSDVEACAVIGEDGGVSVAIECADELCDEGDDDLRMNDSRHVRASLVGVSVVVDRSALSLRVCWVGDRDNEVDDTAVVIDTPRSS